MYILGFITIVNKLFRSILFMIDNAIYNAIPWLYNTIMAIARTSPLSQASIADMASRIYKLLAVFMVFKVTFSLIMYIVNPEDFSDKTKGVSKLVTNIVISLALLVLTPYFFSYAYQLQKIVLEDNSLATIVFGEDMANTQTAYNDAGDQIAYMVSSTFLTPNLSVFDCSNLYSMNANTGTPILNINCFGFSDVRQYMDNNECLATSLNSSEAATTKTLCGAAVEQPDGNKLTKEDVQNYAAGVQFGSMNLLFRQSAITSFVSPSSDDSKSDDSVFAFDYSLGISTVAAVIILLFLITICMDVGLRSIKLAFLQLIAPIPILSYIDPKSGKDGMFKKWYQMCLKTFISLFVRLLALYFAVYIIGRISRLVDIVDGSYVTSKAVSTFIIIGALMFAKDFVKILEGLGVKLDGGFILNPIKKFEEQALGGKRITHAVAGTAVGALGGASLTGRNIFRGWNQGWNRGNVLTKLPRALLGATRGATSVFGEVGVETIKGTAGGLISGEGFTKGWKSSVAANRKMRAAIENGSTWLGRRLENISSLTGMSVAGTSESIGARIHEYDEAIKENQNAVKSLELDRDDKKAKLKERQRTRDISRKTFNDLKETANQKMKDGKGNTGKAYHHYLNTIDSLKNQLGSEATWKELVVDDVTKLPILKDGALQFKEVTRTVTTNDVVDMEERIKEYDNNGFMRLIDEAIANPNLDPKINTKLYNAKKDFKTAFGNTYTEIDENGDSWSYDYDETFKSGSNINIVLGKVNGEASRLEADQRKIDEDYYERIKKLNDKNEMLEEEKRKAYEAQRAAQANNDVSGTK